MQAILRGLPSSDPLKKVPDYSVEELYQRFDVRNFRNKLINGAFEFAQYGTTALNVGSTGKPLRSDRYVLFNATGATVTHASGLNPTLLTHAETGVKVNTCDQISVTVADSTLTGDERFVMWQSIEGYNARNLPYTGFTFSFWIYGPSGLYSAFAGDLTNYCVVPFSIPQTNKWTKIVVRFPKMPMAFAGSLTSGIGMNVGICFALSSTSTLATSTVNAWQAAGKLGLTSQSNGVASNTNVFYTTLWQVEEGFIATRFEERHPDTELDLCRRYCQILGGANITNGLFSGGAYYGIPAYKYGGFFGMECWVRLGKPMRTGSLSVTSNITGMTSGGAATGTTLAALNAAITPPAYFTMSGTFALGLQMYSADCLYMYPNCASSWSGSAGDIGYLMLGPDVKITISGEF
jgi:hypothetical protein